MTSHPDLLAAHFAQIVAERAPGEPATLDTVFQPIVSLETRETVAYEALSRPPRGSAFGSVQQLFEHAHTTGQVVELDRACWRASTSGAARAGLEQPFGVLVNIEPESFQAGVHLGGEERPPVVIELTERALLSAPGDLLAMLDRARAGGQAIAVDDLGAEPASLALLPLLDPDVIKLDLRIIQQQPDAEAARIMSALNQHLAGREVAVIAEGIETERQLVTARALGATHGQGWLFGRPERMPAVRPGAAAVGARTGEPAGMPVRASAPPETGSPTPFELVAAVTGSQPADRQLLVQMSVFLEARALAGGDSAVVLSTFQDAANITPATRRRYESLARECALVMAYVRVPDQPAAHGILPDGVRVNPIAAGDPLLQEWDIVVVTADFAAVLVARELDASKHGVGVYDFSLSHDRGLALAAARSLLRLSQTHDLTLGGTP